MKVKLKIIVLLILTQGFAPCWAQQAELVDTTKVKPVPERNIDKQLSPESLTALPYAAYDDKVLIDEPSASMPIIQPDFSSHFEVKNVFAPLSPYSYSYDNPMMQGFTFQGLQHAFRFTDFLEANASVFLSSAYFGEIQPYRYVNGSVHVNLKLKLFDRVKLVGEGQLSVREGLNPKLPTAIGGANFYGAGVEVKVAKNVWFGVGVRSYYYQGDWTRRLVMYP